VRNKKIKEKNRGKHGRIEKRESEEKQKQNRETEKEHEGGQKQKIRKTQKKKYPIFETS
jgi:hypothetical protein